MEPFLKDSPMPEQKIHTESLNPRDPISTNVASDDPDNYKEHKVELKLTQTQRQIHSGGTVGTVGRKSAGTLMRVHPASKMSTVLLSQLLRPRTHCGNLLG